MFFVIVTKNIMVKNCCVCILQFDCFYLFFLPGGHQCKAGWVTDDKPKLIFRSLVAKSKTKKVLNLISMRNYTIKVFLGTLLSSEE